MKSPSDPRRWAWLRVLIVGLGIWLPGVAGVLLTDRPHPGPRVFLVGSFLVPSALLFWVYAQIG